MSWSPDRSSFVLDFAVIGAQKSGTTTLFQLLRSHPGIYMPGQKETEFFSDASEYAKGKRWYESFYFEPARPEQCCGEASPQYMTNRQIPEKLIQYYPDVRVICVLRNPIDRAVSHYRMTRRRGGAHSTFMEAFLSSANASGDSPVEDMTSEYFRLGCYGRILSYYFDAFDAENIKVLFLEEFERSSAACLEEIYRWLGVAADFRPSDLSKRFHEGGNKRFPRLEGWIKRQNTLKNIAKVTIGERAYNRFYFWFEVEANIRPEPPSLSLAQSERRLIVELYRDDVHFLERLIGRTVPWPDFSRQPQ